jgi:hypothetical protein
VSLEDRLVEAFTAARTHAGEGEHVLAVMPVEPGLGRTVFLAAYGPPDEEPSYLALDARHQPVGEAQLVKDAVAMLALAELAEEASGAVAAPELRDRFAAAREALEGRPAAEAAAAVLDSLNTVEEVAAGPRIATPLLLDRLAAAAAELGAAADTYELALDDLGQELREAGADPGQLSPAWEAIAALNAHADPASFSATLAGQTGPVEQLVADVVQRYRAPLI